MDRTLFELLFLFETPIHGPGVHLVGLKPGLSKDESGEVSVAV